MAVRVALLQGGAGGSSPPAREMSDGGDNKSGFVYQIAQTIYRLRYILVAAWIVATVILAPYALMLVLTASPMTKRPPAGTSSSVALWEFEQHFGNLATLRREMVSFRCKTQCATAATVLVKGWVETLTDMIKHYERENPGRIIQIHSYFSFHGHHQLGENPMISADSQSILLQWVWNVPPDEKDKAEEFCSKVNAVIAELNAYQPEDGIQVSATGLVFLDHAMKETLIEEVPVHEISTIWLPFLILMFALRSPRMLLLALIPMPIEICVSFGLMYFVSLQTTVVLFALMMMLMLCTSLSFDYSLFSLTRYAEERAMGESVEDAVVTVISQIGRVIVVSGCVLMVSWAAMLGLPSPFNGFCIAACSMIIVCVLVQLTFVPTLLAIMPFLGPPAKEKCSLNGLENGTEKLSAETLEFAARGAQRQRSNSRKFSFTEEDPEAKAAEHMTGVWFNLGGKLTQFPLNILLSIVVYIIMSPLSLRMSRNFDFQHFKFKMGHSYELTMPRTATEWHTLLKIQEDFPSEAGILMPMMIMMTNNDPTNFTDMEALRALQDSGVAAPTGNPLNVARQDSFDMNCQMANSLIQATRGSNYQLTADSFVSATFHGAEANGNVKCLKSWEMDMVRNNWFSRKVLLTHTSKHLQELWDQLVSNDKHAMLTFLFPTMDPFSPEAFELVTEVRNTLNQEVLQLNARQPGITFKTFSPGSVLMDLIDVTSKQLPVCFVGCATVCLTMMAVWFWSFLIPFKFLLTVVVPITWTYGAGLYVYEDGYLAFTGIPGLCPVGDAGVDWTVPMFTLTFMMGLALDYEIFLFERVREFRLEGFGDRESIQLGLAATGTTISAAGLIMALTFLAQLLGSIPVTNQMGFILVFSIVVDTFIVRSILVPAMLSLFPWTNYWPSEMPEPLYCWLDLPSRKMSSSSRRGNTKDLPKLSARKEESDHSEDEDQFE